MRADSLVASRLELAARACFILLIVALPGPIAPMSIATGLTGTFTIAHWFRSRSLPDPTPVAWPAVAWAIALAVSAAFAIDPSHSWPRLTKALFPALMPLAAFHVRNRKDGARALTLLLLSSAAAATYGVVLFVARGASFAARARGPTGHYMTFAGQLLLLVSVAFGLILTRPSLRERWWAWLAAALGGAALVCTYTRSAWIGLAVSLAVLIGLVRWRWLPALALALGIGYLIAPLGVRTRLDSSFDPHHPTNVERTYMWEAGARMFQERPWTGVGLQDMHEIYARYRDPAARETPGHLHSVPVQIAASMGVIGLVAFVLLYGSLFVSAGANLRSARDPLARGLMAGVVAGLAGFLVAGCFEWNFGDEELLYLLYVLVGMAWGARSWSAARAAGAEVNPARVRLAGAGATAAR